MNNPINAPKPSGFSFGNTNTNTSSLAGSNSLSGISFNKPTQPLSSNTGTGSGFSFGNTNTATANTTSKPSLFGNSSTNPAFGNSMSSLGMNFGQSQQVQPQQQQQVPPANSLPYGVNFSQLSNVEMPKPLTTASSDDATLKLKRKRSNSDSSFAKENSNGKNISLVGRIVDTFKVPSKYSLENVRGLFTSTKNIINSKNNDDNNNAKDTHNNSTRTQFENYSKSLNLDVSKIPASKSEYRRLIIKNHKDTFFNYDDIDANQVLLSKRKEFNINSNNRNTSKFKQVVDQLKPQPKRQKQESDLELTFSKPLFEQPHDGDEYKLINNGASQSNAKKTASEVSDSEYWCTPSLSELSRMNSLELTRVQNFSAGRKNCGHLMFKYPVDLTAFEGRWNSLLGETISFQNNLLQIYPDDENKPSQGNGLNVPAVVTLDHVFPKTYDPQNPDFAKLERHIDKLKSAHGMKFISFDPYTGNYVFEVEHFSIWGIVDEDEDDPELVARWHKQQQMEHNNEKRKNELQINALEKIAGYGQPGDNWKRQKPDFSNVTPGAFDLPEPENEFDKNGLLLADEDNINDDPATEDDLFQGGDVDASVPTGLLNDKDECDNDEKRLAILKANPNLNDIDELVEVRAYEPEVKDIDMQFINPKTELAVSENWDEQLALSNGFFSVFNKNLDSRNNIKLDPKNVGNFLFGEKDISKLPKAVIEPPLQFENATQYGKCLQEEIFDSTYKFRVNGIPQIVDNDTVSLKIPLLSFEHSSDYTVWELLSILYDDNYLNSFLSKQTFKVCGNYELKFKYIQEIKRKELLCAYLQKLISLDVDSSFNSNAFARDTLDKIFHFICTDKLGDAIQYAINTNNEHTAILLTMLDSNDLTVHKLARSQLKEWSTASLNFIPPGVLKIYKLLTGDILSKEYINHLDGLTWPVVLFLMIKFGSSNKPLKQIIKEFVDYSEQTGISDFVIYQTQFTLLKMVNSSKDVLSGFEVELQFLLMKHLKPFIDFSLEKFDTVIQEFSKKLEKKKMIKAASYVLEHLNNDKIAEDKIFELFKNHVATLGFLGDRQRLDELHNILHIPYYVLHEACSSEYKKFGEYYKSTLELLLAGNLSKAHELMLAKVAPQIIINNVSSQLDKLARLVDEFSTLSDSKIGAGVYGDYINTIRLANELKHYDGSCYDDKKAELKVLFDGVFNGIKSLVESNQDVKIAKTIMTKKLIGIAFKEGLECNPQELLQLNLPVSEKNYLEAKLTDSDDSKKLLTSN